MTEQQYVTPYDEEMVGETNPYILKAYEGLLERLRKIDHNAVVQRKEALASFATWMKFHREHEIAVADEEATQKMEPPVMKGRDEGR